MHDSLSLGDHAAGLARPLLYCVGRRGWWFGFGGLGDGGSAARKGLALGGKGGGPNAVGRVGGGVGYGLGAWMGHKGDPANDREPR